MKVKELIKALKGANPEAEVILQKDAEGNGYSPMNGIDLEATYVPNDSGGGDVYSLNWAAGDVCISDEEWTKIKSKPTCVLLVPVY